jgi:hypothetical protein
MNPFELLSAIGAFAVLAGCGVSRAAAGPPTGAADAASDVGGPEGDGGCVAIPTSDFPIAATPAMGNVTGTHLNGVLCPGGRLRSSNRPNPATLHRHSFST